MAKYCFRAKLRKLFFLANRNFKRVIPDDPKHLVAQVRTVAAACKTLENEVKVFCKDVRDDIARDIDLEKRSVFAELKQVVTQLNNVKNFDGTRVRKTLKSI